MSLNITSVANQAYYLLSHPHQISSFSLQKTFVGRQLVCYKISLKLIVISFQIETTWWLLQWILSAINLQARTRLLPFLRLNLIREKLKPLCSPSASLLSSLAALVHFHSRLHLSLSISKPAQAWHASPRLDLMVVNAKSHVKRTSVFTSVVTDSP